MVNSMGIIIKHSNWDFVVSENNCYIPALSSSKDKFSVFQMRKSGYTTFEAVHKIAMLFKIKEVEIGYCGLKDEDAITTQLITIPAKYEIEETDKSIIENSATSFLELHFVGYSDLAFKIGQIQGNSFRINVRNVPSDFAEHLFNIRKQRAYIPNYYDVQRFGTPDGKKVSHIIGEHLIKGDYNTALKVLIDSKLPESEEAQNFEYDPKMFFDSLDLRKVVFYYNAYASYKYNELLKNILVEQIPTIACYDSDIDFALAQHQTDLLNVLKTSPLIEFTSYGIKDNQIISKKSYRQSIICPLIHYSGLKEDLFFPSQKSISLSFSLESGCYATMVIKQIFSTM